MKTHIIIPPPDSEMAVRVFHVKTLSCLSNLNILSVS